MDHAKLVKMAVRACEGALEYIGDNDGECKCCKGNGETISYYEGCACYLIREFLAAVKAR